MNPTNDRETIELDGNDLSPHTNPAAPPPIPEAARRPRSLRPVSFAVHTVGADRDTTVSRGALTNRHTLTFPPSPPVPRRPRGPIDWRFFLAVVTASSVSMGSAVGAVWVAEQRHAPVTVQETAVLEASAKPATVAATRGTDAINKIPSHTTMAIVPVQPAITTPPHRVTRERPVHTTEASSSHVAPRSSDALTPEVPMLGAVEMAQQRVRGAVMVCGMGVPNATAWVRAVVTYGSDGRASRVELSAPWAGTAPGQCIENAIRTRATLPAFAADSYRASFVFQTQ